jgi:hypothetical protein
MQGEAERALPLPAAFTPKSTSFRCRFDRLGDPQALSDSAACPPVPLSELAGVFVYPVLGARLHSTPENEPIAICCDSALEASGCH